MEGETISPFIVFEEPVCTIFTPPPANSAVFFRRPP
jgi:hypothetical protein